MDNVSERAPSPARASPREPSIQRDPSPQREPSIQRGPSPQRELSMQREPSILREPSIQREPSILRVPTPPRQPSIQRGLSPPRQPSIQRKPSIQREPIVQSEPKRNSLVGSRQASISSPKIGSHTSPRISVKGSPAKGSRTHSPAKQMSHDILKNKLSISNASQKMASKEDTKDTIANLEPQGQRISKHIEQLNDSVKKLALQTSVSHSEALDTNIDKIAEMSKILTHEANTLRQSIKHLSEDICRTEVGFGQYTEDITDFPYHLFLLEIIINKIQMKCDCFDMDCNNLVISAHFLGKHPIILYDSNTNGCVEDFFKINIGKSIMFAMTYDKICAIKDFEIVLDLNKQPPCSHCITKIGTTKMDYTKEFLSLREELCMKWADEQPKDNIICTTSTPMLKNQFYILCSDSEDNDAIGIIEVSVRMSFLGKEITTAFSASPTPKGTSRLLKEGNGMTMYSCQKVEMDEQGKVLLDEDVLGKNSCRPLTRSASPMSEISSLSTRKPHFTGGYMDHNNLGGMPRYDEIFTKMNDNELKIRVPKSTKVERVGRYEKIQELCECEETPYNTGDQIQFQLPSDIRKTDNTYTSNLKYTIDTPLKTYDTKNRKVINVTPTNCSVPVDMEKRLHSQKDVFILKIGKKLETKDKKTDLEIELVTPKAPGSEPVENNTVSQQVSNSKIKDKKKIKNKKGEKGKKASVKASKTKKAKKTK
ncbi:uncharacterized protein LOC134743221 [Cydia strobilella]|uniref:uncharacterized protein LOC134743221 n=1 Tax=Cydia strobilella TaxID=1100964 RepID=UPI003004BEE7